MGGVGFRTGKRSKGRLATEHLREPKRNQWGKPPIPGSR